HPAREEDLRPHLGERLHSRRGPSRGGARARPDSRVPVLGALRRRPAQALRRPPMRYEMISADCHLDLCWLPPDLFTTNATAALRDRMPHVIDQPKGPTWVTTKGANLGLACGMGSAGREYVPGRIHRADRMAETGLYSDGKKGIR